jgi:hypothetical protein
METRVRRLISEIMKFVTESCQKVVHNAMQVVGGIGYSFLVIFYLRNGNARPLIFYWIWALLLMGSVAQGMWPL